MRYALRNASVEAWRLDAQHPFEIDHDKRRVYLGNGAHFYIISYDDYVVLKPDGYYYYTHDSFHRNYECIDAAHTTDVVT